MGASVSLMEVPHEPELSREIKTEYETLVETDMSLDAIEEHLSGKYSSKISKSKQSTTQEKPLLQNLPTGTTFFSYGL